MILVATLTAKPGQEAAMEARLKEMVANVAANEAGALAYTLHRNRNDPRRFMIYEQYRDQKALESHGQTDHFKALGADLKVIQEGATDLTFYDLISGLGR